MKKTRYLWILSLALAPIALASCNFSVPTTEDNKTLTLTGSSSLRVGETLTLTVNVTGLDSNSATFSSSDEAIVSVNNNGEVTGIGVGIATITATSTLDTSIKGSLTITVSESKSSTISLVVYNEDNEDIFVGSNGVYNVPAGQTFKVGYELEHSFDKVPDSVSYAFSNTESYGTVAEIEYNDDGTAYITTTQVFSNLPLVISASYLDSTESELRSTTYFTSYDLNQENNARLAEILSEIAENEDRLITASYKVNNEYREEFRMYNDASYSTRYDNSDAVILRTYSSVDTANNMRYFFSYNEDKSINNVFVRESYEDSNENSVVASTSRAGFYHSSIETRGFSALLSSITSSGTYNGYYAFGEFSVNANAEFSFDENKVTLTSEVSDTDTSYNLEINYNENNELTSYKYEISRNGTSLYSEEASSFVYGTKTSDNTNEISLTSYYITSFEMVPHLEVGPISEATNAPIYDYSDPEKYGYVSVNDSGEYPLYTVTSDKALPLIIDNATPSTSSTLIDTVSVRGTMDGTSTRQENTYENGVISLGTPKDETSGGALTGLEVIVFTTQGGGTYTIGINWITPTLTGLDIDIPSFSEGQTAFPAIRVGQVTDYIWISDSEDAYSFDYKLYIVSGDQNGLALHQTPSNNNLNYPTGTYYIEALKEGNYEFYFGFDEMEDLIPDYNPPHFTLSVTAPIAASVIEEAIVGETFLYNTGTMTITLNVTSSTQMSLYTSLDETIIGTIEYTISDNSINITGDKQTFDNTSFYYESVLGGEIEFNNELTQLTLFLRNYDSEQDTDNLDNFYRVTFTKPVDPADVVIENRTFTSESTFVYGHGMSVAVLKFETSTGTIEIQDVATHTTYATFSFEYSRDESGLITVNNVTGGTDTITFSSFRTGNSNTAYSLTISVSTDLSDIPYTYAFAFKIV